MAKKKLTPQQVWYRANKEYRAAYSKAYREAHPEQAAFRSVRKRAKELGVAFNLTVEDLVAPARCPVLGIKLQRNVGGQKDNSPSLDRLVPARGYVKGNVKIISSKANAMKRNGSLKDWKAIVKYMEANLRRSKR